MKVVILAGGLGTRISEESHLRPKPMIEIGGRPILWHIMKLLSHQGFNEFTVCLGYKGPVLQGMFSHFLLPQPRPPLAPHPTFLRPPRRPRWGRAASSPPGWGTRDATARRRPLA